MDSDSSGEYAEPRTWWQRVILILLTPIVMPVTFLVVGVPLLFAAAISIPVSAVTSRLELRRERRYRESLAERNRCLTWKDFLNIIASSSGSLIIEWRHKRPVRLWWTPDNILVLAPCAPPDFEKLDFLGLEPPHQFIEWCDTAYTNDTDGTAMLCVPPYDWSPGRNWPTEFQAQHPNLTVVNVVPKYTPPAQSAA